MVQGSIKYCGFRRLGNYVGFARNLWHWFVFASLLTIVQGESRLFLKSTPKVGDQARIQNVVFNCTLMQKDITLGV
jgi:hypothetical protein